MSEIDTGYTWIDGKHIYKKTINVSAFPNSTETNLGNLLPSQIYIVKIEGTATSGSGVLLVGGVRPNYSSGVVSVRADQSTGEVLVGAGFDARSYGGYITFYYTKNS